MPALKNYAGHKNAEIRPNWPVSGVLESKRDNPDDLNENGASRMRDAPFQALTIKSESILLRDPIARQRLVTHAWCPLEPSCRLETTSTLGSETHNHCPRTDTPPEIVRLHR